MLQSTDPAPHRAVDSASEKKNGCHSWVEAGFIGGLGRVAHFTNGLDNLTDKRDILNALLAAIPDRLRASPLSCQHH